MLETSNTQFPPLQILILAVQIFVFFVPEHDCIFYRRGQIHNMARTAVFLDFLLLFSFQSFLPIPTPILHNLIPPPPNTKWITQFTRLRTASWFLCFWQWGRCMKLSYGCTEQGQRLIKRTRKDAENIFGQPERSILFGSCTNLCMLIWI